MAPPLAKPPVEPGVRDLALLITSASRLLTNLAAADPFANAKIGLAEWLAMTLLADKDGVSNRQLARSLGVTDQRVNQLCTSLAKSGLIAIQQSPDDKRRNVINITAKGAKELASLNAEIEVLLATALTGREKTLAGALAYLRRLMRLLLATKQAKAGAVHIGR